MNRPDARVATINQIVRVARDVFVYHLALNHPIHFEAGQFVNLRIPDAKPRPERSYSVYSAPGTTDRLELCIKLFPGGAGSEYLRARQVGDTLDLTGPFGMFTLPAEARPVVFVATATGVAPFRSMLLQAARDGDTRPFQLYFGVRAQEDLFMQDDIETFARTLGLRATLCLSRPEPGWTGFTGRVTAAVQADHPTPDAHFFLCGNGAMITELRTWLKERGLERRRIHVEKYY